MKRLILVGLLLIGGCVPPYQPPTRPTPPKKVISIKSAFDNYTTDTAKNFRNLAQKCQDGAFEYVSELIDAAVALDEVSKDDRVAPINKLIGDTLGSDKLDKDKAVKILLQIADELDPAASQSLPQQGR